MIPVTPLVHYSWFYLLSILFLGYGVHFVLALILLHFKDCLYL